MCALSVFQAHRQTSVASRGMLVRCALPPTTSKDLRTVYLLSWSVCLIYLLSVCYLWMVKHTRGAAQTHAAQHQPPISPPTQFPSIPFTSLFHSSWTQPSQSHGDPRAQYASPSPSSSASSCSLSDSISSSPTSLMLPLTPRWKFALICSPSVSSSKTRRNLTS